MRIQTHSASWSIFINPHKIRIHLKLCFKNNNNDHQSNFIELSNKILKIGPKVTEKFEFFFFLPKSSFSIVKRMQPKVWTHFNKNFLICRLMRQNILDLFWGKPTKVQNKEVGKMLKNKDYNLCQDQIVLLFRGNWSHHVVKYPNYIHGNPAGKKKKEERLGENKC